MSNGYRCMFSFYGSKSRIAHRYPVPVEDKIIEPFAGGATYSLRYSEKEVILCEKSRRVSAIWAFLLSPDVARWVSMIPMQVEKGSIVDNLIPDAPIGLVELLRAEANQGTQGARGVHKQVTMLGEKCWPRLVPRLRYWVPRIQHWKLIIGDYHAIGDTEATWFIDPPYNNPAGRRYQECNLDYSELAAWCRSREGQVIVCENLGADWLPFTPLVERQGIRSRYQKSKAMEVIYCQGH